MKVRQIIASLIGLLAFAAFGCAPAHALPRCTDLAANGAYGLAGNPVIVSPTSSVVAADGTNAAYCSVQFTYSALSGPDNGYANGQSQAIKIVIGLPLNSQDGGRGGIEGAWNGKLEYLGEGGCAGSPASTLSATNARYVGSGTDTGHTTAENGQGCDWGVIQDQHILNLGKIADFFYDSLLEQVRWTKKLAHAYYRMDYTYNYWNGCSTGGRQGLSLAQRYPNLGIDGYVIGAPAIYHQEFRLSDDWPAVVMRDKLTPRGKTLTQDQINAANASAIAACDVKGHDQVADGIIDDPRACRFSAKHDICGRPGAPAAPNCLDRDQAAAVDEIWDGPRNHFGKRIWFPFDRGVTFWNVASALHSTLQVMNWNHRDLNYGEGNLYINQAAILAAGNPPGAIAYENEAALGSKTVGQYTEVQSLDLSGVKDSGAKIIMWQGTADPLIRWRDSMDYYRRVAVFFGGGVADFDGLQSWFRYFHAPGVGHCGGGVGPSPGPNLLPALERWVEKGIAPNRIIAVGGAVPTRTRPLCPYPQTAIYKGSGSTDDAANFRCGGNLETKRVVCDSVRTPYKHENTSELDYASQGVSPQFCAPSASVSLAQQ